MKTGFHIAILLSAGLIWSCSPKPEKAQDAFFTNLSALCGKSFAGKLVSTNQADKDLRDSPMVMHVQTCTGDTLHIPFHIADNRSRTWILTKTDTGLRLKHRHNHEDGHADKVTMYGGYTLDMGSANRQTFPVDQYSKDMFMKNGLDVSVTNIWAVEITNTIFAYELRRENRHFRVEFDLSQTVETPRAPW
ncbi:MAG: hypothetical protein JKX72_05390 [Robiginitomaculum sp.]|nr:hypothetical protein [Robiginitomaculum sp.]